MLKRGFARFAGFLLSAALVLGLCPQAIHAEQTEQSEDNNQYGAAQSDSCWLSPDFPEGDYSMVVLPDTQFMVNIFTDDYYKMMQWVADNRDTLNIQAVMHMGDMVHETTDEDWSAFKAGMTLLDEAGIPWMPMMGNHDDSEAMHKYFDYQTYGSGRSWFGGSFHADKLDHTYWFVTVGSREYMILALGWAPNWDVLDWAKGVVETHPDKNVIINCHAYMSSSGKLLPGGQKNSVGAYHPGYPEGTDIWEAFRGYENVVLAMGGHVSSPDIVSYVDQNGAGENVHSLLIDNQDDKTSLSAGMVAVLTFHNDSDTVELSWYSTKKDAMYGPENQYAIHVPHVDTGSTEAEDITGRFVNWTEGGSVQFADGLGYGEPGCTQGEDKKLKYSDFIPIGDYDRLELTICGRYGYTNPGGFAFYTAADPAAFLSHGADARTGNGANADGTVVRTVAVPEGANYIRVTYWSDASSFASVPFRCVGYRTVPACEHDYRETVTAPTCTEQGYTAYVCTLCGNRYTGSFVPATGHSYGPWYVLSEAACETDGQECRDCGVCGHRETAVIGAPGHSYEAVVTEPTCTEMGYTTLVCTVCGYTEPKEVLVDITDRFVWTQNTAIQATTGKRVADGNWISSDYVDISGHDVIEIVTANTAAANTVFGLAFYDENKNYVSGLRHTDGSGVYGILVHEIEIPENVVYIRATWYSGKHAHYDSAFGDFYCLGQDASFVDALGHTPGDMVVENETEDGGCDQVIYCLVCGEELSRVHIGSCSIGDINGDGEIDILDANMVVSYYNERRELSQAQLLAADVNGDGEVDMMDANMIVAYYNEKIDRFPVEYIR